MDDDRQPQTEPWGSLEPPRRRPPTALGVMTPPPPPPPDRPVRYRSRLRQRLAQGFVGAAAVTIGATLAAVTAGAPGFAVGAALALGGARLVGIAVRPSTRELPLPGHATRARRRAA